MNGPFFFNFLASSWPWPTPSCLRPQIQQYIKLLLQQTAVVGFRCLVQRARAVLSATAGLPHARGLCSCLHRMSSEHVRGSFTPLVPEANVGPAGSSVGAAPRRMRARAGRQGRVRGRWGPERWREPFVLVIAQGHLRYHVSPCMLTGRARRPG